MKFNKIANIGFFLLIAGIALAQYSDSSTLSKYSGFSTLIIGNNVYAGGAAGQRAQCPNCGNYYFVGTYHKCPQKPA